MDERGRDDNTFFLTYYATIPSSHRDVRFVSSEYFLSIYLTVSVCGVYVEIVGWQMRLLTTYVFGCIPCVPILLTCLLLPALMPLEL